MRDQCARLARILIMSVALACIGLPAAAVEDIPVSLISYDAERPVALAPDDPLAESVGVLFLPPEHFSKMEGPMTGYAPATGYATAFLVSECYALAAGNAVDALPASMRFVAGSRSVIEPIGLRFGLGLKPGSDRAQLTEGAFRTSWQVTMHKVVPEEVQNEFFETTRWWLLHLEGCKTGAKENGKPIAYDLVTSVELQESGLPVAARHVGALLTDQVSLMELPKCQLLGAFRSKQWESTCSSWLGMAGGPVLTLRQEHEGLDCNRLHTAA